MQLIAATVSQLLLAVAVPYFLITVFLGVRVARRDGALSAQEEVDAATAVGGDGWHLYFLVPCLNESVVIGATVKRLLADPACRVVVIDDDSEDGTVEEVKRAAADAGARNRVRVARRHLPDARQGKGAALNAGLPLVIKDARRRRLDPARVVIGVMDADGRLSEGGARVPLASFTDPRVGAVQLIVRIRNRRKLICKFQDVEFWMISAVSQFARSLTGTVSLGGNGQFTRLSALLSLDGEPWSRSLTEDLDLGLRLAAAGWRVTTTTRAYVDQQGVESYRRLLRQRTRWYQGHMTSIGRLPELWASDRVGQVALIELTSYLLVPWIIVLPWSIIQQWVFYEVFFGSGRGVFATGLGSLSWQLLYGVLWYLISFLPNLVIGLVYARRTHAVSLWRALLLGHLMILWNYIGYVAAWRGLIRMIRGRTGWDKTSRTTDLDPAAPAAAAKPVAVMRGADRPQLAVDRLRSPCPVQGADVRGKERARALSNLARSA